LSVLKATGKFEVEEGLAGDGKKLYYKFNDPVAHPATLAAPHQTTSATTAASTSTLPFMVKVEILICGNFGPQDITPGGGNIEEVKVGSKDLPFLNASEFIRAKVKAWIARGSTKDFADIYQAMVQYESGLKFDRISANGDLEEMIEQLEGEHDLDAETKAHVHTLREIYTRLEQHHK
jgi:hypothetical protein